MAQKTLEKGVLITFEGGEGGGKSTHTSLLISYLRSEGYEVLHSREPGGVRTSEAIRELILDPNLPKKVLTELFLFEAARAQYTAERITPALDAKQVIVSDRFFDSTTVYQGYAGGLPVDVIGNLNRLATGNIVPDLTFVIDVPVEIGLERTIKAVGGNDFFDNKGREFHARVNQGFRALVSNFGAYGTYPNGRMVMIDYRKDDIDGMQSEIRRISTEYLGKKLVRC